MHGVRSSSILYAPARPTRAACASATTCLSPSLPTRGLYAGPATFLYRFKTRQSRFNQEES